MKRERFLLSFFTLLTFILLFLSGYIKEIYQVSSSEIEKENRTSLKQTRVMDISYEEFDKILEMRKKRNHKTNITIAAVGDIMFHIPQIKSAFDYKSKEYNFTYMFKPVEKYIKEADLAIGNFETVTAGPEHGYRGFPMFNTPKSSLKALKDIGFDILSTVNNHCLDGGKEGLIETIENINDFGLKNIGTYKEPTKEIFIENIKGVKIALLAYTYGCNGLESRLTKDELKYMVNIINENKIKRDIELAKNKADIILVYIHWGNEYQRKPSRFQIMLAEKMFDWGADIILGSHPHVIQKAELKTINGQEKFVIYSMGNFISNQRYETLKNRYTEDGVIVKIYLEKDFARNTTKIKDIEYIPTWVNRYISDGKYKYEILPTIDYLEGEIEGLSKELLNKLKRSYNATISTINQN